VTSQAQKIRRVGGDRKPAPIDADRDVHESLLARCVQLAKPFAWLFYRVPLRAGTRPPATHLLIYRGYGVGRDCDSDVLGVPCRCGWWGAAFHPARRRARRQHARDGKGDAAPQAASRGPPSVRRAPRRRLRARLLVRAPRPRSGGGLGGAILVSAASGCGLSMRPVHAHDGVYPPLD